MSFIYENKINNFKYSYLENEYSQHLLIFGIAQIRLILSGSRNCHFFLKMSISSDNLSQKTIDVSLTIGKEKPQFISVNRNLTIQQLRVFLFVYENYVLFYI